MFTANKVVKIGVVKLFKLYLLMTSIIGIICFFSYILGLPINYKITEYYSRPENQYINYGICYLFRGGLSLRLCGLFNEPGYFGTVLGLVLCVENFNFKKKSNIVLFFAGCLSFSLAFIMIYILYLLLSNFKRFLFCIFIIGILPILINIIPDNQYTVYEINNLLLRLTITENGLVGNNRSTIKLDNAIKLQNDDFTSIIFGKGAGYANKVSQGHFTYKSYYLNYGLAGFFLILCFPMIIAVLKSLPNYKALAFVIVFGISIMQRPDLYSSIEYFAILFGGIECIKRACITYEKENVV